MVETSGGEVLQDRAWRELALCGCLPVDGDQLILRVWFLIGSVDWILTF